MRWAFAGVLAITPAYGCGKGTPAPPLTADGSIDSTTVCTAPGIEFDSAHGQVAVVEDSVRGEIFPEKHSHRIKAKDLRHPGRVIARVRLLDAGKYTPFGLSDTTPVCLHVEGDYPDSLVSTIYAFDGRVLKTGIRIRAKHGLFVWHVFHAEAHWVPVKPKEVGATIDLRPPELRADAPDSLRRREAYAPAFDGVVARAQGSCTHGGCCPH